MALGASKVVVFAKGELIGAYKTEDEAVDKLAEYARRNFEQKRKIIHSGCKTSGGRPERGS
ncbi:MAG: hypothetical protein R2883_01220 [Caldisericia bacterium]